MPNMNAGHLRLLHKIHTNSDKAFSFTKCVHKASYLNKIEIRTQSYLLGPSLHIQNRNAVYICVYMYIQIYTHTHTCICIYIYIHMHAYSHTYTSLRLEKSPIFSTK